ncbi:hypothetical protein [Microbispora sp. NPDC049125]|uniref:hypothetical protein n=1 Tax=Microbispora sp. NPDC049125 TaxID=3154929 RepID=UPI003467CEA3
MDADPSDERPEGCPPWCVTDHPLNEMHASEITYYDTSDQYGRVGWWRQKWDDTPEYVCLTTMNRRSVRLDPVMNAEACQQLADALSAEAARLREVNG